MMVTRSMLKKICYKGCSFNHYYIANLVDECFIHVIMELILTLGKCMLGIYANSDGARMKEFMNELVSERANKNVNLAPYEKLIGSWNFEMTCYDENGRIEDENNGE